MQIFVKTLTGKTITLEVSGKSSSKASKGDVVTIDESEDSPNEAADNTAGDMLQTSASDELAADNEMSATGSTPLEDTDTQNNIARCELRTNSEYFDVSLNCALSTEKAKLFVLIKLYYLLIKQSSGICFDKTQQRTWNLQYF